MSINVTLYLLSLAVLLFVSRDRDDKRHKRGHKR